MAFAVEHVRAVKARGGSVHAAARELGVSAVTVGAWMSRGEHESHGLFREVLLDEAAPPPPPSAATLTLTTPSGHVVAGLCVDQAAALLRTLS